jgi:hypothetical protein
MADALVVGSASRFGSAVLGAALMGLAGWLAIRNLSLPGDEGWFFWLPVTLLLLTLGVLCWWFTLSGDQATSRAAIRATWRGGWIVGWIGLGIGMVGPLVFSPKANLGPLLGVLVTGPLGFVVGVVGAAVVRALKGGGERIPME